MACEAKEKEAILNDPPENCECKEKIAKEESVYDFLKFLKFYRQGQH